MFNVLLLHFLRVMWRSLYFHFLDGIIDLDWPSGKIVKYTTKPGSLWHNMAIKLVRVEELQTESKCSNQEQSHCLFAR